jgi:membrane protease YdiL (CAAX protease family)
METEARNATIIETSAPAPTPAERYARVAGPLHTISVLLILGAWAFVGKMDAALSSSHIRLYLSSILAEWLVFAFVAVGVWRSTGSLPMILGKPWRSARQLLRDCGVAAAFWVVSIILLAILGLLLRVASQGRDILFLLPHGVLESALWIAVSVTAGICEETIFRGYLQSQFIALTKNVPAGVLLSAVAFGAVHAYQGWRRMIVIGLYGLLFGILARWRGTVRPGMIAHAWQDSLTGLLATFIKSPPV